MRESAPKATDAASIAVIRTDRIGDLILTTPLLQSIKEASPRARIFAVAARYATPVLERNPYVDEILVWDPGGKTARDLAERKPEAAILLNPELSSCLAARKAGIPYRTGPLSRPVSFFFLNRGLRQRRSRAGKHQSELDAAFAPLVTGGRASGTPKPLLRVGEEEREAGARILRGSGAWDRRPLAGLHPGSGDSAIAWPEEAYALLGRLLVEDGWSVVLTGNASEVPLARRLLDRIGSGSHLAAGEHDLRSFFGLLSHLDLFVAPSTGPLHAAAALGVPVASPFPPLPSQSPERWGPRGAPSAVLAPVVECPARTRCRGARCRHYPCMETVRPEDLRDAIRALRRERRSRP